MTKENKYNFNILNQISQLLETLQKDPQKLAVEGEKMAEFMHSLAAGEEASLDSHGHSASLDSHGHTPSPKLNLQKDGTLSFQVYQKQLCT